MSDLRIVIFLKFVRFGANFGLFFIFAMSVLPNLYFKNKDDLLYVRGNMRVCLLLFTNTISPVVFICPSENVF